MKKITAAICTYNRYDVLSKAVKSLQEQTLPEEEYRVIIVDNSPDWDYAAEVQKQYQDLPFLEYVIEKIPGLSNARNVAARMCGTEYIAYMDDDAIASPQWLEKIIEGFELFGSNTAVVGGKVEPIWDGERPSWLGNNLLCYVSAINWGGELRIAKESEWFAGCNISFHTQDILDNGGFDVNLGRTGSGLTLLSNEETDLLGKLRKQGKNCVYAPEASVCHLVEQRRLQQSWFRQRVVWQAVSDYILDPEKAIKNSHQGWNFALEYFFSLPPKERNIRGLFYDTDNPQKFKEQLWVIGTVTNMMLAGFEGIE